jgi:hypothetical protein
LAEDGKMHKAIIYDALEQFILQLNGENLTLVEWGCKQGIASMLVLDYIREKQLDIEVAKVILIDDDTKALSRAEIHTKIFVNDTIEIMKLNSKKDNFLKEFHNISSENILNIFANDKENVNLELLSNIHFTNAYFMCVSNTNSVVIDKIKDKIGSINTIKAISYREGKIGRFTQFERIFQINNITYDIDDDEISLF